MKARYPRLKFHCNDRSIGKLVAFGQRDEGHLAFVIRLNKNGMKFYDRIAKAKP